MNFKNYLIYKGVIEKYKLCRHCTSHFRGMYSREACQYTQTSIRLASHLVRAPITPDLEDMRLNPVWSTD
jgi:hypothetical protein